MKAVRLKTNQLYNPIGIDCVKPTLSWNCEGGVKQTAYQVVARNCEGLLLWNSGKISCGSMGCVWGGADVPPRTRVLWHVTLWDENGIEDEASEAYFETGIGRWSAQWITGNYIVSRNRRYPVDCFRKRFEVTDIKAARLYITACGLYEARLNGKRVGEYILTPGITDYRKRVQYQTYDVTQLLNPGENTLTVQLADGWYRGSCGAWGLTNQYGTVTKLLARLEWTDGSGQCHAVVSDSTWDWSNDGPIRFADNKDGEKIIASYVPSYSQKAKATKHRVLPVASNNVPVTEHERLKGKLVVTPSGKKVLDFGQNIAGYAEFSLWAHEGQRVFLRFGELMDDTGEFTQKNIQCVNKVKVTPLQQVEYICKEGLNRYKTTFAVFGLQYILVETDADVHPEDFTAVAVYSDMERTGYFACSNALLNKFVENTVWSTKNNHLDLPTDCPTRERHGWSGDAQIFCSTACYLFDYDAIAKKYLRDLYDWQKRDGKLPQLAPSGGADFYMCCMDGSVGWADAGIIMPYVLWKQYGDTSVLNEFLPGMRRYIRFQMNRCGKWYPTAKHIPLRGENRKYLSNCGQAYGEWAEPDDVHHMTWKDCAVPNPEVATAYVSYVCGLMSEIEAALGNNAEAELDRIFSEGCKKAYRALRETSLYPLDTDRQAQLARPLAFGLLDEKQTAYAKKRLVEALDRYGWRLGTGFLSTPLILDVLANIDINLAYRLLENEEMPGWLFMPKNGATTVWEAWEGSKAPNGGIASLNHYSKGAMCRWLFDTVCGIRVTGDNHFTLAPRPGGSLRYAKASYLSVYGYVTCGWENTENGTVYTVNVPANCTAEVRLPGGCVKTVSCGMYTFGSLTE